MKAAKPTASKRVAAKRVIAPPQKLSTFPGALLLAVLLLAAQLLSVSSAAAQQTSPEPDVDSLLSGFSESESEPPLETGKDEGGGDAADGKSDTQKDDTTGVWLNLDGFLRLDSAYNFAHQPPTGEERDYRGLSKLRVALRLEWSLELGRAWKAFVSGQVNRDLVYDLRGREHYSEEVLTYYSQESEWRQVYLHGALGEAVDLKLGRQIVVWGKSDTVRIIDVLNPVDNREPGLVDIEDIRLPLTMSRLDWFFGDWSLSAIAIHEIRFNKNPVPGNDFYPAVPFMLEENIPADGGPQTEYALALEGIFSGFDLSFYWARIYDDEARIASLEESNDTTSCQPGPPTCERRHDRITMSGMAFNMVRGGWLFKAEAALFEGLHFFNLPQQSWRRLDMMLGVDYAPLPDHSITLEAANRSILNHDEQLRLPPDEVLPDVYEWVLSYRVDLLRQTLALVLLGAAYGAWADEGGVTRFSLGYDLIDALTIGGGVVLYHPGSALFDQVQDNDRLFADIKYSF